MLNKWKHTNKLPVVFWVLAVFCIVTLAVVFAGVIFMVAWNCVMPIMGLPKISFLQSVALWYLISAIGFILKSKGKE